jgi:hypothetical protein
MSQSEIFDYTDPQKVNRPKSFADTGGRGSSEDTNPRHKESKRDESTTYET